MLCGKMILIGKNDINCAIFVLPFDKKVCTIMNIHAVEILTMSAGTGDSVRVLTGYAESACFFAAFLK